MISIFILLPFFSSLFFALNLSTKKIKQKALLFSFIEIIFGGFIIWNYIFLEKNTQLYDFVPWSPSLGVNYFVGIDGLSILPMLAILFCLPIAIFSMPFTNAKKTKTVLSVIFLLQFASLGSLFALDIVLFFIFEELFLILSLCFSGILFREKKYFHFSFISLSLLLVGILFFIISAEEKSDIFNFYSHRLPFVAGFLAAPQNFLFLCLGLPLFLKGFGIPFRWGGNSNLSSSDIAPFLSILFLGLGASPAFYGFARWVMPLLPEAREYWMWTAAVISCLCSLYYLSLTLFEKSSRKIAFSLLMANLSYAFLGLFNESAKWSIFQIFNIFLVFSLISFLFTKVQEKEDFEGGFYIKGVVFTLLVSGLGLPMTNIFSGHILIFQNLVKSNEVYFFISFIFFIFNTLLFFRVLRDYKIGLFKKMNLRLNFMEKLMLGLLSALIVFIGFLPNVFLSMSEKTFQDFLNSQKLEARKLRGG